MRELIRAEFAALGGVRQDPLTRRLVGPNSAVPVLMGGGAQILNAATAGQDSGWVVYTPGMRLSYALDSGSATTTFSVDISADGQTSLGQAYTGSWASSTAAESSGPIWLTNPQARYIRVNVLSGGPISFNSF